MAANKLVSLIVPTLNRDSVLLSLLDNIHDVYSEGSKSFQLEVVIVDQSDIKFTDKHRFNDHYNFHISYTHLERKSLPNARNVAMEKAKGEFCIFIDDDVVLHKNFIEEHVSQFDLPGIGAVAGKVIEDDFIKSVNASTPSTMYGINNFGKYYPLRGGNTRNFVFGFPGGNFSIRKSLFKEIGLFDLRYSGTSQLEETDYAYRIRQKGYKIVFNPDAALTHLRVPAGGCRVPSLFEKRFWRFHNSMLFFLKHKNIVFVPFMIIALSTGGFTEVLKKRYPLSKYFWSLRGFKQGYKTFSN